MGLHNHRDSRPDAKTDAAHCSTTSVKASRGVEAEAGDLGVLDDPESLLDAHLGLRDHQLDRVVPERRLRQLQLRLVVLSELLNGTRIDVVG